MICEERELLCVSSWPLAKVKVAAEADIKKAIAITIIITVAVVVIATEVAIQTTVQLLRVVITAIVRPARHLKNQMGVGHPKVTAVSAAEKRVTGPVLVL